jgi:hypothetical protein
MYQIRNSGKWKLGIKNVKEKVIDVKCNSHSSSSKSSAANGNEYTHTCCRKH